MKKENTERKAITRETFFFFLSLFLLVLLLNCCTYFCSVHDVELFWMSLLRKPLIRSSPLCISQTLPILQMIATKFQTHTTDMIFARSYNLFFICQHQGNTCKSFPPSKINCMSLKKTFINWPGLTSLPTKKHFCRIVGTNSAVRCQSKLKHMLNKITVTFHSYQTQRPCCGSPRFKGEL